MKFYGKTIVKDFPCASIFNYQVIKNVLEYKSSDCIIIKSMNPDYILLFDQIKLIITEKGSPLAHLAIIARDYEITVIRIPEITQNIPKTGKLDVFFKNDIAEIEI